MAYDLAWCKITAEAEASAAVRRQTGHKLKSALSYIFRHYTLDDLHYPSSGMGFRCACMQAWTKVLPCHNKALASNNNDPAPYCKLKGNASKKDEGQPQWRSVHLWHHQL